MLADVTEEPELVADSTNVVICGLVTAAGPDIFSAVPTIIGVGVGATLGRTFCACIGGIESVMTTSTGVGVASTADWANPGRVNAEKKRAAHKSFIIITAVTVIYYDKGCRVVRAMEGPLVGKDSPISKKVVKLKAFIYINYKDKLYVDCDSIALALTSKMNSSFTFMRKLFGTDGIRGVAGEFPLDDATVQTIGRALTQQFLQKLGRSPRFVTGRDTRESGERIESAFHSGATANGAECKSAGVITTPGVAFVTGKFGFDAGIVISASHNPYRDNGIKIFSPNGKKVDEEIERLIEKAVYESRCSESSACGTEVDDSNAATFQTEYSRHLIGEVEGLRLDGLKIAVDCANGAASEFAPGLFRKLGADVVALHAEPDGRNINENCGSLHLEHLQKTVTEQHADFGVAFDGDADRALFVDEKGRIVDGDGTLWIMSQFLRDKGGLANDTVVATVMSNIGLEIALASCGIKLVRTPVGDKYVLDELLKSGSDLGGEQSGHVIFPKESLVGDGMMTALFMLDALRTRGESFSSLSRGFVRYPQVLVNVHVKEKKPFDAVDEIATASRKIEAQLEGEGRLLLRYSGTENLARVMIEGKDQTKIEEQANSLAEVIRTSLG